MNKIILYIRGCDDHTVLQLDVSESELVFLQKLCGMSDQTSKSQCQPDMKILREGTKEYEREVLEEECKEEE